MMAEILMIMEPHIQEPDTPVPRSSLPGWLVQQPEAYE